MKKTTSAPNLPSLAVQPLTKPSSGMRKSVSTHAFVDVKSVVTDIFQEYQVEAVLRVPSVVAVECRLQTAHFPSDLLNNPEKATQEDLYTVGACLASPFEHEQHSGSLAPGRRLFLNEIEGNTVAVEKYMNMLNRVRRRRRSDAATTLSSM